MNNSYPVQDLRDRITTLITFDDILSLFSGIAKVWVACAKKIKSVCLQRWPMFTLKKEKLQQY